MEKFTYVKSAFSKEISFELYPKSIHMTTQNGTSYIPYGEIKSVRLQHDPTRIKQDRYICTIKHGLGNLEFSNAHYVSPANFKDVSEEYRAFINALHTKLDNYPAIKYFAGNSKTKYIIYFLISIVSMVLVFGVGFFMFSAISGLIAVKLLLFIGYCYLVYKYLKKNKPAEYTPQKLPSQVLP